MGEGPSVVFLPRAAVVKAARDLLPQGVHISSESCDLVASCCNEFIGLVSSEASEIAPKVVAPQHIVQALHVRCL